VAIRLNLRWCSGGLEFTCWNGEFVQAAFIIDAMGSTTAKKYRAK